jgi:hypothetical protein
MDKKSIIQFFKDRPSIPLLSICREIGISATTLRGVMSGTAPLTDKTIGKLLSVFKRYGYISYSEPINRIRTILQDERIYYSDANVFINAPLALEQIAMKTELYTLLSVLDEKEKDLKVLKTLFLDEVKTCEICSIDTSHLGFFPKCDTCDFD